tara:strand:- start:487 stop:645 length:159 start_codon:yes stop_codon:yes gene_type:complete
MENEEDKVGKQSSNNGSFNLAISFEAEYKISETKENWVSSTSSLIILRMGGY